MTVKVSDARALLGVSEGVTREQAMRAVDAYVETFVHMNEPSMATRAFEAFGVIAVERDWMTQAQADRLVIRMSADIDQRHAELAELHDRHDELVKRRDALEKRYDTLTDELSQKAGPLGPILAGIARLFRPSRGK